jgi:hypothetical protein
MLSQPPIDVVPRVSPTASFDPPVVRPGETTIYRVTFNALEESIEWPINLAAPPQLKLRRGAHAQMLEMAGTNLQPHTTFNYQARASEIGQFTIPEYTVAVYGKPLTVPAAQLEVSAALPPSVSPAQRLVLEMPVTNLFVGQPTRVRILQPASAQGLMAALGQVQVTGESLLVDPAPVRQHSADGNNVLCEMLVTPIATGKLSALAQGFTLGLRSFGSGPVVLKGPVVIPSQGTLLDSEPVEFEVKPLPREGELPGFTGAVGAFSLDPPELAVRSLRVGEPVKLTVKVHGDPNSNLGRLVAPPAPKLSDWQVFAPTTPDSAPPQLLQAQGFATFTFTLVPLSEKAHATPAIPFSCFDPTHSAYTDLTVPSLPVTVKPGAAAADLNALVQASAAAGTAEKEPVLSQLAASPGLTSSSLVPMQQRVWFPLVQLAPASAFLGLWGWDRRRRFLEQHPEVILRRRARRALRREWRALRRAARASDASRFAAAAASALRVACSPHYPAEPRALVGGDVLALLPEADRLGRVGEVVRRFFVVTDASRFGTAPANPAELLPLQPDLERVLEQLEEKL